MKITESKLRRILRKIILEFGEKDHELKQKLQNRDRMIGRGIDMGTMPFNPNWDYDKRPSTKRYKGKIRGMLSQVVERLEQHGIGDYMEAVPGYHSNQMKIKSGDMVVEVKYLAGYGEHDFTFKVVAPAKWRNRWSEGCDTIDSEIDRVLDSLNDWVNKTEMQEMGEG